MLEAPFALFFRTDAQIEDDGHVELSLALRGGKSKRLCQLDRKMVSQTGVNSPKPK